MMVVGITGGTGFVGTHLAELLQQQGHYPVVFTRNERLRSGGGITYATWDPERGLCDIAAIGRVDALVNLAGAGIADRRWTSARKKEIRDSRINGTSLLVERARQYAPSCKTFISASAIGYYGADHSPNAFTEADPPCTDFLGQTCHEWETEALRASDFARMVLLRFGIVMGKESGVFPQFARPVAMGVRPVLGSGKQVISWISVSDLCRLIVFILENETLAGIYNAVAPNPVSQKAIVDTIGRIRGGISIPVMVPALFLNMLLGESASEVLKSTTVSAGKILATGFEFRHPDINTTISSLLGK